MIWNTRYWKGKSIVKETVSRPELRELVEYSQEREYQQSKGKTVNSPDIAITERGRAQTNPSRVGPMRNGQHH